MSDPKIVVKTRDLITILRTDSSNIYRYISELADDS